MSEPKYVGSLILDKYAENHYPFSGKIIIMEIQWFTRCLCRHFNTPTYNRDILTTEDHLNLLATPKGYRWYGPDGERQIRKRAFLGKHGKKKRTGKPFPSFQQFLVDIWSVLTPEMVVSLKEILQEEFGMTPQEAFDFLVMQKAKAERMADLEMYGPFRISNDDMCWARTTARTIAEKMTQYADMMTSAKKTQRSVLLRKKLHHGLLQALNIQPGDDTPLKKMVNRLADGLAIWLSSIPGQGNLNNVCCDLKAVYSSVTLF